MTLFIRCGLALVLAMGLCTSVLSHDGEVKITGTIQDNTCELAPDSQSKKVLMGSVATKQFMHTGDVAPAKPFSINLQNCGPAASEATVTFSGTPDSENGDLFALENGTDAAKGLALGIYDNDGKRIAPGGTSRGVVLTADQTSVELRFSARYEAVTEGVTAGRADATATFIVNYN